MNVSNSNYLPFSPSPVYPIYSPTFSIPIIPTSNFGTIPYPIFSPTFINPPSFLLSILEQYCLFLPPPPPPPTPPTHPIKTNFFGLTLFLFPPHFY